MKKALISAFVVTTETVQSLYFLKPKFQASSHLWLYSLFVWDLVGNPKDRFSFCADHIRILVNIFFFTLVRSRMGSLPIYFAGFVKARGLLFCFLFPER